MSPTFIDPGTEHHSQSWEVHQTIYAGSEADAYASGFLPPPVMTVGTLECSCGWSVYGERPFCMEQVQEHLSESASGLRS